MHKPMIVCMLLAGCATGPDLSLLPFSRGAVDVNAAPEQQRRANVEVFVKTNHPALIADIARSGGPMLTQAMDLAGITAQDRPARLIQLRADIALYQQAPSALVTALLLYAG